MSDTDQLPRNDVAQESNEGRSCTVEYLNYEILDEYEWELDDNDLFEKAADADLSREDYGTLEVNENDYILEAAENQGDQWPFSCREGSAGTCAAIVKQGEIHMKLNTVLSEEEIEQRNTRLTCIGKPDADELQIVYNAKHLDFLQERAHF
jgi:ferredoxin